MANNKKQTVWVIIYECGDYSAYMSNIQSVWDSKEAAEICVNELRKIEKASRTSWATSFPEYSVIEVPLNKPGNYWPGQG